MDFTITSSPTDYYFAVSVKAQHNSGYQRASYGSGIDTLVICHNKAQAMAVLDHWIGQNNDVVEYTQEDLQSIYDEQDRDMFPTIEEFLKYHYSGGPDYYLAGSGHYIGKRGEETYDFADSQTAVLEAAVYMDEDGDVVIQFPGKKTIFVSQDEFKWLDVAYTIGFTEAKSLMTA